MDGRTDGRTNERYGEIRSGTVGGPSRLAEHPLFTEQSRSGHLLQLPHSLFVSSSRLFFATFSIYLTLPTSTLLPRRGSLNFSPASLLLLPLYPYHSSRRLLFTASSSHPLLLIIRCDPPSLPRCPNIPFHRSSSRCRTGTRNSSLPTHDSTTLGYASSRYREYYLYSFTNYDRFLCIRALNSFMLVSFGLYEL